MRIFVNLSSTNEKSVKRALYMIADENTSVDSYRNAFKVIGQELGKIIVDRFKEDGKTVIACPNEDADWLVEGLMNSLNDISVSLAVFWSDRLSVGNDGERKLEISPIISSYEENISDCETLIIAKSIISTSCVVRTQLTRLIGDIKPKRIIIAAPVMYKDAEESLRNEFPDSISSLFEFVDFAIDDVRDEHNIVRPGIGGYITKRLGLGNNISDNNSYIPEIVKKRFEALFADR